MIMYVFTNTFAEPNCWEFWIRRRHSLQTLILLLWTTQCPNQTMLMLVLSMCIIFIYLFIVRFFYYLQAKKKSDPLSDSIVNISNSISELVSNRQKEQTLKYSYIWQNLDHLFQKMSEEDVTDLNMEYMKMAYEKIPKK